VNIVYADLGKRVPEQVFGKTGTAGVGDRADIDHPLDSRLPQRSKELGDGRTFITDGEDAHFLPATNSGQGWRSLIGKVPNEKVGKSPRQLVEPRRFGE
jgi:hypothetical protein